MGRMKNMKQVSLLGLSSVASICVFSACWALLLDGSVSRQVTGLLDLLSDVLKEDVMRYLEQRQMELVDTITTIFVFLLPCVFVSFQPLSLNFPSVMAFSAFLICLLRILLQEFDALAYLGQIMADKKKSGLHVWRNIVPDIETDRVFLVSS